MKRYLRFAAPIFSLLALFILLSFKTIPSGKLWKGFNVIYVPVETDDSLVIETFNSQKIHEHYELSGQFIPLLYNAYSPEITMLRLNNSRPEYDYLSKRNAYFFDKSNKFRLYYIPSSYKVELKQVVSLLSKQGIKVGVDGSASYPFLIPVITLILIVVLALYSKNKYLFCSGAFFGLIYVLCNPFYSSAVAVCLALLCIFYISNVWLRKGMISYILGNYAIPVMAFFSILGSFAGSVKAGFMFLLTLAGAAGAVYTYFAVDQFFKSKRSFVPVFIRPAKRISLYGGKQNQTLISIICSVVFLIVVSTVSSSATVSTKFSKVLIPGAKGNGSELVSFSDYYDFAWNVAAYPYTSLNKNSDKNMFSYPHYSQKDGKITETKQIKAYNQSFKEQTFDNIDSLRFNAIEKVLKTQGKDVTPGYCSSGTYRTSVFALIMMLVSLSVLLFIYISIIIRKGVRK